ncbi:LacI family DNA-binding transcriptional regulator [Paenibacillus oralis]|uniref:LacI family DNA-binding transcriptional regulator n=1 Tax=Paenibacillus oralis TaxID=2490856 RepID=A0A3P3U5M1_9BACL|nr:LacI family DNA-binding transcriptional regulator [Paenibacillus oralis]RRJ64878.1 LacI family DNA-binding transcriptional regulator [Paenibacillus oralis]
MANIQEIARLAGVSTATVSRVINRHPYVNDLTRERVLKIIEQLDYVPNSNAKSLKKGMTRIIGVIAVSYSTLLMSLIRSFHTIAQKYGFNIMLFMTNGDCDKELEALEMLRSKQLDALLCLLRTNEWDIIESYTKYGPIVTWQRLTSDTIPSVFMDQYQGYMLGLEYLYAKGYRKILNVYSSKGLNTLERIRAYRDFIQKHGLNDSGFPQFHNKMTIHDGEEVARWWIKQMDKPEAISCSTDEVAAGILTELRRAGFSVPDDVGIMGFDNTDIAHLLDLTTIHYPVDKQAENAFNIIKGMLEQSVLKLHSLEFNVVERRST